MRRSRTQHRRSPQPGVGKNLELSIANNTFGSGAVGNIINSTTAELSGTAFSIQRGYELAGKFLETLTAPKLGLGIVTIPGGTAVGIGIADIIDTNRLNILM